MKELQRCCLVQGDMIRLVALDLVLGVVSGCVVDISFPVDVLSVNPDDAAADPASFRVPSHVIIALESLRLRSCR